VKPVQMIADAIKDISGRNGIVLDLFGGSGSTLIAAHKTGRRAFICEYDPILACPSAEPMASPVAPTPSATMPKRWRRR